MTERAFLCRCEDVTLTELDEALAIGLRTIEELKRYTGLGTGPCQGKECMCALASVLVERGIVSAQDVRPFTARPPCEPVTFGALAAAEDDSVE